MNDEESERLTVVKHNTLIDAGYKLSIYENRILLTCISKIDSTKPVGVNDSYTITAADLRNLIDVDDKNIYKQLQLATNRLMNRMISMRISENELLDVRWVSSARYMLNTGSVIIKFSQDIVPHISELSRDFTQYKLNNVLMFKSNYSIRFYELFAKWKDHERVITIEWIKEHFKLENKYTRTDNLKTKVIDVAMNEINKYSDIKVSYEQVKRGRTITAFKFTYSPKSKKTAKSIRATQSPNVVYKGGVTSDEIKSFMSANPELTAKKQIDEVADMIVKDRKSSPLISVSDLVSKATQHNEVAKMKEILNK